TTKLSKQTGSRSEISAVSTNEGGGVGRLFMFVVDQSTLDPGNGRYVATAAERFLNQLTLSDRSALMMLPVGTNIAFTWAHNRVRDGLRRVSGMMSASTGWEYGSLSEARDISNRNVIALRMVAERECRSSIFAGGSGGG